MMQVKAMTVFWLTLVLQACLLTSAAGGHVQLPKAMTWANLAWGFQNGGRDVDVDGRKLVLVDLFDETIDGKPADDKMKELLAAGHVVMCYMSAGTAEDWRPDFNLFKPLSMQESNNWPSEFYLDISQTDALLALMKTRLQTAVAKGCHAVEPDNVDCYENQECYGGLGDDFDQDKYKNKAAYAKALQIDYLKGLSGMAHNLGLAIVLKNAASIVPDIGAHFDGVLTENCFKWDECDSYSVFPKTGRAHFNTEYISGLSNSDLADVCRHEDVMQSKYCSSNKGEWLCTKSSHWMSCSDPKKALPDTKWGDTNGTDIGEDDDNAAAPISPSPTSAPTESPTRAYPLCKSLPSNASEIAPIHVVFVMENMNAGKKGVGAEEFAAIKTAAERLALGLGASLGSSPEGAEKASFAQVDVFKGKVKHTGLRTVDSFVSALESTEFRGHANGDAGTLRLDKAVDKAQKLLGEVPPEDRRVIAIFARNVNGDSNLRKFELAVAAAEAAGIEVIYAPVNAEKETERVFKGTNLSLSFIKAKKLKHLLSPAWEKKAIKALCP